MAALVDAIVARVMPEIVERVEAELSRRRGEEEDAEAPEEPRR